MIAAAGMAVVQIDMKRLLAFSTVSVLGMLTMLVGVGTELAIKAMSRRQKEALIRLG